MIRISLPKETTTLKIGSVSLTLRPFSTAIINSAQSHSLNCVKKLLKARKELLDVGAKITDLPNLDNEDVKKGLIDSFFIKGLAISALTDWEGVYELEKVDGKDVKAELTEDNINHLMDVWFYAEAVLNHFNSQVSLVTKEGNFLSPVVSGTSGQEASTAQTAENKTYHAAEVNQ